ncbi:MAG: rod shape-determining protein MreC [Rickettsiales bacterium]|jgi:rod shape-determining protein MreC|nr:rod shape-determining protein MreC [Rickettsiales bacterium]
MIQKQRDYAKIIKSVAAAVCVPVLFLYVFLGKPDYKLMNAVSAPVAFLAGGIGDIITWPVRAVGNLAENIREHNRALDENAELSARLDAAHAKLAEYEIMAKENERLRAALGVAKSYRDTTFANIVRISGGFARESFELDTDAPAGAAVISTSGDMVGVTVEPGRVRTLSDAKSEIPVRIAGTDVFGFLRGRGGNVAPIFDMPSDPEFVPSPGDMIITSKIGGNIPDNIPVGRISDSNEVILNAPGDKVHSVFVIKQ